MKNIKFLILLALAIPAVSAVTAGCGNQEAETKKAMESAPSDVERNKQARAIFDKVGGDAKKLTAEDTAKLKSLFPDVQGGVNIEGLFAAMSRKAAMGGDHKGK